MTKNKSSDLVNLLFEQMENLRQVKNRKVMLGLRSGTTGGRFAPGDAPCNKGRTWSEWMPEESQRRSRATQYKTGNLPHNTLPLGSERVTGDGYVEVKVSMRPSGRRAHDNWVPKARIEWEKANGRPVPDGCIVVFLDGNNRNFDPDNLALETRAEHAVISSRHLRYADQGSHDVAVAIARLKHTASMARKEAGNAAE